MYCFLRIMPALVAVNVSARARKRRWRETHEDHRVRLGSRHAKCPRCGRRVSRCSCTPCSSVPLLVRLVSFANFIASGSGGRRYFSDCLDLSLLQEFIVGLSFKMSVFMVIAFRHTNRLTTIEHYYHAFGHSRVNWGRLRDGLSSCRVLYKAFSIPTHFRDGPLGKVENLMAYLRALWDHRCFKNLVRHLQRGVSTRSHFEKLEALQVALRKAFPACFGFYRCKCHLDNYIRHGWVTYSPDSYPVCPESGTSKSLRFIYKSDTRSPVRLREFLADVFSRLRRSGHMTQQDSAGTVSLQLCGWDRSKKSGGGYGTGLQRAIAVEEAEYLQVKAKLRQVA